MPQARYARSGAVSPEQRLRLLWTPVTIRVGWELVLARVRVRPAVLADIREHVLRCLPPETSPLDCDLVVARLVHEYLDRVREDRYEPARFDALTTAPLPSVWRRRLVEALDPLGRAVVQLHYGDGLALSSLERQLRSDRTALEATCEGIREMLRQLMVEAPADFEASSQRQLDLLLRRIANTTDGRCPGPMGLLSDAGRDHAETCARCARALRLVRQGVLSPGDLFVPDALPLALDDTTTVAAIQLHPDAGKHRKAIVEALGPTALPAGTDTWLLEASELETIEPALRALCEAGKPPRYHLRGRVVKGAGRWRRGVVVGPLPHQALAKVRQAIWSEVEGLAPLPVPSPPPPSAVGFWAMAAVACALAVVAGHWAMQERPPPPEAPLQAQFQITHDRVKTRFDTSDLATVDIVLARGDELLLVGRSARHAKGAWATGEGDYAVDIAGDRLVIISSLHGIDDLEIFVAAASADPDPIASLQRRVRARHPTADIATSPPRVVEGQPRG